MLPTAEIQSRQTRAATPAVHPPGKLTSSTSSVMNAYPPSIWRRGRVCADTTAVDARSCVAKRTKWRGLVTLASVSAFAAVVSATVAGAPAPVVPPPNLHYGMNAHDISAPVADRVKDLNAGVIRVVFGWDVIEGACKGCFDWSVIDAWRDQAKRTGRTIYATLAYTPRWAN